MAGEAEEARPSSWTERSNICEEAGDGIPGDDELRLRDGDAGAPYGCETVCGIGAPTPVIGDAERIVFVGAVVAVVGGILVEDISLVFLVLSSSFFLPKPQNLRLTALPSSSGAAPTSDALFKPSPKSGTDEVRDPVSSPASLLRLIRLSAIVAGGREGLLLQLHGWLRSVLGGEGLAEGLFSATATGPEIKEVVSQAERKRPQEAMTHLSALTGVCGLLRLKMYVVP